MEKNKQNNNNCIRFSGSFCNNCCRSNSSVTARKKKEKVMCNVTIDFQKISNSEKITQDTNKVNFAGLDNSNNKK